MNISNNLYFNTVNEKKLYSDDNNSKSYNDLPIFLIGMMGSGKTTIGKILAESLGKKFIDLDKEIELISGKDIPTIFQIEHEEGFRKRETEALQKIINCKSAVIATGGGIILSEKNRIALKKYGIVIYLKANLNELFKRTYNDNNRPLLSTNNPYITIQNLLELREPLYIETSDFIIDTCIGSMNVIIDQILSMLKIYEKTI